MHGPKIAHLLKKSAANGECADGIGHFRTWPKFLGAEIVSDLAAGGDDDHRRDFFPVGLIDDG